MAGFQADPMNQSAMLMDMNMDPMYNNINLDHFSEDVQMGDVGSVQPSGFEAVNTPINQAQENGRTDSSNSNNTNTNGVGAGPLPSGYGAPVTAPAGSTLTEFTKRRNWSQRVLEEIKDLLYILTPDGRLLYVSPSARALTGYDPSELTGKFISDYIHTDDSALFIREFNESISTGNPLRFFYRFRTASSTYTIFECHGHPHLTNDISHLEVTGGPAPAAGFCRGFFMMARPYPTSNSQLLDSFLEHKIENVRLQARIAALKREEVDEAEAHAKRFHKAAGGSHTFSRESSEMEATSPEGTDSTEFHSGMPPPAKPGLSNIALTREALDEANAFARPDSITDKMARYEGSSHVDSIEMLTGLHYREGERSLGISTGGASPALIRGDAGIDIPADKSDPRSGIGGSYLDKKPKKAKDADEFVCTDCGTLDSPEWRRGPNGPKTLCNACGLRWAKKEKKKEGNGKMEEGSGGGGGGANGGMTMGSGGTLQQGGLG